METRLEGDVAKTADVPARTEHQEGKGKKEEETLM